MVGCLLSVDLLSGMFQENDKPTLKHLQDTQVKSLGTGQPMYFVFRFHFEPSEYFTSEVD